VQVYGEVSKSMNRAIYCKYDLMLLTIIIRLNPA